MDKLIEPGQSGLGQVIESCFGLLMETGLDEVVGGSEVLEAGLRSLAQGLLPLAGELVALDAQERDLSDAVYDPDNAPYVSKLHGFLNDLLTLEVPAELIPWAKKVALLVPPPEAVRIREALFSFALGGSDPMTHALGRFFVFEAICLRQRLALLVGEVRLEALGGRQQDVEAVAERELRIAEADPKYQRGLLELDDPLAFLQDLGVLQLGDHVQFLKDELATMTFEMAEVMERRRQILEVVDQFPPDDGLLILNETADEFGEQRLAVHQLRRLHHGHLGSLGEEAAWKRVERYPDKIGKLEPKGQTSRLEERTSFADLLIEAAKLEER